MTKREFEALVREAIEGLPDPIRPKLANTVFTVRDRGQDEEGNELLGLYEGTPYPDREGGEPLFPDRITLYQKTIEEEGGDRDGILRTIRETILHEVGHFLGLDDDELHEMGLG
jgi:predicted Zn-dependent protease with MMP-like domain